jgi:2-polyprenyl-3-methyl-5-hydroxy-6-metoxy-1,4-benzoquinol methylase
VLNSEQRCEAAIPAQVDFWNTWNAEAREAAIDEVSIDQSQTVRNWLRKLGRTDLDIIDVGCGAGWMCGHLLPFGNVTGVDLSDEVLGRAAKRLPTVKFVPGDFMSLSFPEEAFDVAVSLEVLSHVSDQPAFVKKLASILRPGGQLMLATQNRPQLERNDVPPPAPGQIRQWVDRDELSALLSKDFVVQEIFSITPKFNRGFLRYVNSGKLNRAISAAGLGIVSRQVKKYQENKGLGWTLMALAQKVV